MITQEKMNDIFITTLESIIQVCSLITSGNVAHYVPSIEGKCQSMLQFYKENHVSTWHSVVGGDLPQVNKDVLFSNQGYVHVGYMREDKSISSNDEHVPLLDINDIDYWMEIPELPK